MSNFWKAFLIGMGSIFLILAVWPTANPLAIEFHESVQLGYEINRELDVIRQDHGADSIFVSQYHNGINDFRGTPFIRSTVTYMSARVTSPTPDMQPRPIGTRIRFLYMMWEEDGSPQCVMSNADDAFGDTYLRNKLSQSAIHYIVACPIYVENVPLGNITATFTEHSLPDDVKTDLVAALEIEAQRVGEMIYESRI